MKQPKKDDIVIQMEDSDSEVTGVTNNAMEMSASDYLQEVVVSSLEHEVGLI